ncbi:MAG: hypothetical protein LBQ83_03050 [Candidatus Margulisbacteria bacterium]|jgi:hypothetical protein|nr:hypothetical protein [Candidatus Margulisiibacteriota bacterium]
MALDDVVFAENLTALFQSAKAAPMSEADFAEQFAAIIDAQIKTATVLVSGVQNGTGTATGGLS